MSQKTYEELAEENKELIKENEQKAIEIENLELQLNWFKKYVFGSKRETTSEDEALVEGIQCSVFGEVEDEEIKEKVKEETEKITVHKHTRKRTSGIKKSELKNVEEEIITLKLEDDKLVCPECREKLNKITTEVLRQEIEYVPAKLKLKTYVREVYKCTKCGTAESEKETPTIVKVKAPRALLAHSFASSSLAAEVIYEKYYMGVPLYRQEKSWDDKGLVLPRSMTSNWCIKLSEYYSEPIYKLMLKKLKENSELLHCDETTMQCNKEKEKKASSNSYMWVIASGELEEKKWLQNGAK